MPPGSRERRRSGRPSMVEVARLAGVSHQTVSRVINKSKDVSEPTRLKVEAAIRQLGYRPSNSARALASSHSRTIGLVAGGVSLYGPVSTITAIETVARSHGLFMSVMMVDEATCTQQGFQELCGTFLEQNVDAFIFITPTDTMFQAACQVNVTQPRVIVTSTHGGMGIEEALSHNLGSDRVALTGIDQWGAIQQVVRQLVQLGHRRVLYMAGPPEWRDASTRLASWWKACAQYHVKTAVVHARSWESAESYTLMNHLIDERGMTGRSMPTAVVTATDNQAVGVARSLQEHGIRIPQDVSLAGFDDIPTVDNLNPPLSTVRPRFEELGTATMRQLLAMLHQGRPVDFPVTRHGVGLIQADVVPRRSLGRAVRRS